MNVSQKGNYYIGIKFHSNVAFLSILVVYTAYSNLNYTAHKGINSFLTKLSGLLIYN